MRDDGRLSPLRHCRLTYACPHRIDSHTHNLNWCPGPAHRGWQGGGDGNGCGECCPQHRSAITRRKGDSQRDGQWPSDGVECEVLLQSDRVQSIPQLGACGRRLARRDENRASGSDDRTACVWSLSTGAGLVGPLKHIHRVLAAKFSPDGQLIASATRDHKSVRVYDSRNGSLLVELPVKAYSVPVNQSIARASNSLFYHTIATSIMSTCPPRPRSRNGRFTAAARKPGPSPWQATARSSQPPLVHRCHFGTQRAKTKLGLSSSTLIPSSP